MTGRARSGVASFDLRFAHSPESSDYDPFLLFHYIVMPALRFVHPLPFVPLDITFPDPLDFQARSLGDLKERDERRAAGMKPSNHPHASVGPVIVSKEMEHGSNEVLMFARHPQTIRSQNPRESMGILRREIIIDEPPFMSDHCDSAPEMRGDVLRAVDVKMRKDSRRGIVGDHHFRSAG
jgi:hypothetical protein